MRKHLKEEHSLEKELQQKIKKLQSKMFHYGLKYGLSDPRTIKISQKLDIYLNEFQKR